MPMWPNLLLPEQQTLRELTVDIANEALVLLPEQALLWQRMHTLIVADVHWGSASSASASRGVDTNEPFARLDRVLSRSVVHRIVFLGDLLHSAADRSAELITALSAWRDGRRDIDMLLIRGNLDRHARQPPPELSIRVTDGPLLEAPFVLTHYPAPSAAGYVIAGHLQPTIRVRIDDRLEQRPCFWFGARVGVLPAFGGVSDVAPIEPAAGDSVFIIDGDIVRAR